MRYIKYKIENKIGLITLDREEKYNSFNLIMLEELYSVLEKEKNNAELNLLMINGAGEKSFCSGVDLNQLRVLETVEENRNFAQQLEKTVLSLFKFPKPTIALLNGYALGGGFGIAASCDYRIISEKAKVGFPAVQIGAIMPVSCTLIVSSLIGEGKAKNLMLTGRLLEADEALQIGLIDEITSFDKIMQKAQIVAKQMLKAGSIAVEMTKKTVNINLLRDIETYRLYAADNFAYLSQTKDWRERMKK